MTAAGRCAARIAAARANATTRSAALDAQIEAFAEQQALTTHDDEHDPEGVTIGFERAQILGLLAGALQEIAALDRAASDSGRNPGRTAQTRPPRRRLNDTADPQAAGVPQERIEQHLTAGRVESAGSSSPTPPASVPARAPRCHGP